MSNDYYNLLGVDKSASQDEIKRAFRKLAHQYHPDKETGDEAKFKEINAAYQVLGDEKKRAQYDQFGSAAFENGGFGQGGFGGAQGFSGFENVDFGDMFGDMFGFGGRSRKRERRGADIQKDISISFANAARGVDVEIEIHRSVNCKRCAGLGNEPGTELETCGTCTGSGTVIRQQRTILGAIQTQAICSECEGDGKVPEQICSTCRGTGLENGKKTLKVTIPSGISDGQQIRLNGEGEAGPRGGKNGDLYLRVRVKADKRFRQEGWDIISTVEIGFTQAMLGDKVDVDTVDGVFEVKIPAGIQSGTRLRIPNRGISVDHRSGDHMVEVIVKTPKKLSKAQKKLIDELDLRE